MIALSDHVKSSPSTATGDAVAASVQALKAQLALVFSESSETAKHLALVKMIFPAVQFSLLKSLYWLSNHIDSKETPSWFEK